ncbi:MAG TPA: 4-(cytidine 5'-diphospho)-2-C-methyl-D-erythritol kinase [Bryobacteraceae bacterium]|nr:4-(cytidine 5'-diphospho)-2-C-methyl-D-erythritol kinase [Bryobacteraceae bacterium]
MSTRRTRRARVRALAKINLDLRVLEKRADGYHELRTIFQTISLADSLEIAFTPGSGTAIELDDPLALADNLVLRAARLAMEAMGATGRVAMRLTKRIPMGAGLGGGSSDAAAVLLALPPLAGGFLDWATLAALGREIGSDVPFFLLGGCAAGIGRGTELFPLPDRPPRHGLLVAPRVHVSTAEAYGALSPSLTTELQQNKIFSFQSQVWDVSSSVPAGNDFEPAVFGRHPELAALKERLLRAGASPALMTGSGSALFGLFRDAQGVSRAIAALGEESPVEAALLEPSGGEPSSGQWPASNPSFFRISLVNRARYRASWWRWLKEHCHGNAWPPRSRYA